MRTRSCHNCGKTIDEAQAEWDRAIEAGTCPRCRSPYLSQEGHQVGPPGRAGDLAYAGFWRRFGAFWLDVVVLLPLLGLAYFFSEQTRLFQLYWLIPGLLFDLWYNVYLVARYGGTPGKLLLNIRVALTDGSPVTTKAAALRHSVLFVLSALSSLALLWAALQMTDTEYFALAWRARGERLEAMAPSWYPTVQALAQLWIGSEFVTMLFTKKRRAIHDFIAGTVVLTGRRPHRAVEDDAASTAPPHLSGRPE